jgi:hypothetical protein
VNISLDPNAPLYLGHLAIAAINGEALLIILVSKADLLNPTFIHFKNVSYISGNDKKYEISIHSNQKDQNYEFSCKDDVDYDMWLFHLKQAQKITNGETGRKLRFCNFLFDNQYNDKNIFSTVIQTSNDLKNTNEIGYSNTVTMPKTSSSIDNENDDDLFKSITHSSRIPVYSLNNKLNKVNNEPINYSNEQKKENKLKATKTVKEEMKREDDFSRLNDTLFKENKIKKNSSQSYIPTSIIKKQSYHLTKDNRISESVIENDNDPHYDDLKSEIFYKSNIFTQDNPSKDKLVQSQTNNDFDIFNPSNYSNMSNDNNINTLNNPIINNNINLFNPDLNTINQNLDINSILNSDNNNNNNNNTIEKKLLIFDFSFFFFKKFCYCEVTLKIEGVKK